MAGRGFGGYSAACRSWCIRSNRCLANSSKPSTSARIEPRLLLQHPGQADGEGAALAQFALDRDLAAQQLAQFLDDRKPQAAAGILAGHGVAAGHGRAALAELLEDRLLVLLGDAHARVAHLAAP